MATLGGKYLIERPIQVADDGIVSIGDAATVVWGLKSIGIGSSINSPMSDEQCVLVGSDLTLRGNTVVADVLMGRTLWVGQQSSSCVLIGDISSIDHNTDIAIAIGREATIGNNSTGSIVMGYLCTVANNSPNCTLVGQSNAVLTASQQYVALYGYSNTVFGSSPNGSRTEKIAVLGSLNTVGTASNNSHHIAVVGSDNVIGDNPSYIYVYGSGNTISAGLAHVLVSGDANSVVVSTATMGVGLAVYGTSNTVTNMDVSSIIGQNNTVNGGTYCDTLVVIGYGNTVTNDGTNSSRAGTIVIGGSNVLPAGGGTIIAIGNGISAVVGNSDSGGILIGLDTALTATTATGIAIGDYASAGNNQCVIGCCSPDGYPFKSIHQFIVRGLDISGNAAIDTINVIDTPAAGSSGLTVVYNTSGTFTNKTLKAALAPPAGSLLAYFDPA